MNEIAKRVDALHEAIANAALDAAMSSDHGSAVDSESVAAGDAADAEPAPPQAANAGE